MFLATHSNKLNFMKVDCEEIDMRFQAPSKPGMYNFTIYVRSGK